MKNKHKILITIISLLFTVLTALNVFSTGSQNEEEVDKELIYSYLMSEGFDGYKYLKNEGLGVDIESIARVYIVDIARYVETEKFEIFPWTKSEGKTAGGKVYIAKVINDNGDFCGNLEFYVLDGIARQMLFTPSPLTLDDIIKEKSSYYESCKFSDNKELIEKTLNFSNISDRDVRIVMIDGYGWLYYIENPSVDAIVSCLYTGYDGSRTASVITKEELLNAAKEKVKAINDELAAKAKWESEHPGEIWSYTGNFSGFSDFIRPAEIKETKIGSKTVIHEILAVAGITIATATAATVVLIRKRRFSSK